MKRDLLKAAVILAALAGCWLLLGRIGNAQRSGETDLVRTAVKNAALTCYAVEGAYPDDVSYLEEHYGLSYDEENYYVRYEAFAANQLPEIRVMERGAEEW
ncbi:MAG: hypothetical protein IJ175_07760 [Clostridia bacterium]|nr:hypothetical protein [Clostridia bacterium]